MFGIALSYLVKMQRTHQKEGNEDVGKSLP